MGDRNLFPAEINYADNLKIRHRRGWIFKDDLCAGGNRFCGFSFRDLFSCFYVQITLGVQDEYDAEVKKEMGH